MSKFLVIGKDGQLGKEFIRFLTTQGEDFVALGHNEINIADLGSVISSVEQIKPSVIINTSAYNQVDLAEKDYEPAYKTNSFAIGNLIFAAKKYNSFVVHYSSDYVFDGEKKDGLYIEEDIVNPQSEYGKSKYLGETFLNDYENSLLFRVSWVFGEGKQNFIYKFLQWTKNNHILKVSSNETSIPTSTKLIVEATLAAIENGITGKYHITNSGYCSRYEFAKYIVELKELNNIIYPVNIESFNLPAKRPMFSAMNNKKISDLLNIEIPYWKDSVKDYISGL